MNVISLALFQSKWTEVTAWFAFFTTACWRALPKWNCRGGKGAGGPALVQTPQQEGQWCGPFSTNGDAHTGTGWEGAGSLLTPCLSLSWSRLDPCDSQPCQNGGTCVPEGLDKYHCLCPLGYGGDIHCGRCEPVLSLLLSWLCPASVVPVAQP